MFALGSISWDLPAPAFIFVLSPQKTTCVASIYLGDICSTDHPDYEHTKATMSETEEEKERRAAKKAMEVFETVELMEVCGPLCLLLLVLTTR